METANIAAIKEADQLLRTQAQLRYSVELTEFWEDLATQAVYRDLQRLGLGNPDDRQPLHANILRRVIEELSVLYSAPASRELLGPDGEPYPNDSAENQACVSAFARSAYDLAWQSIDQQRNLYRTIAVTFDEVHPAKAVRLRTYAPHNFFRKPSALCPEFLSEDSEVLFCVRAATEPKDELWYWWLRDGESWYCWLVNGAGSPTGQQPYGESGETPFSQLPAMLVHDSLPMGRGFLPIPESRVAWCKTLNRAVADLGYLVQQEAHTRASLATDQRKNVPTESGPGTIMLLPGDAKFQMHPTNPKIAEAVKVMETCLALWSVTEGLPADHFLATRKAETGQALRVKQQSLARRRLSQIPLVACDETLAFDLYRQVHNVYALDWGVAKIPEQATLRVTVGRSWQPVDLRELQDVLFKDLGIKTISKPDYVQERFGLTRDEAEQHLARVDRDFEIYPMKEEQNPLAILSDSTGPNPALGKDSQAKNPGAFNPDLETATHGASIIDAAKNLPE